MELRRKATAITVFGAPLLAWLSTGWAGWLPVWAWLASGLPLWAILWLLARRWETPEERHLRRWIRRHRHPRRQQFLNSLPAAYRRK